MHNLYMKDEKYGIYDCDTGEFFPLANEQDLYKMLYNINTNTSTFEILTSGVKVKPIKLFGIGYKYVCDDALHPIVAYRSFGYINFLEINDIVDFDGGAVGYAELNDRVLYVSGARVIFDIEQIITDYIGNIETVTIKVISIQ